MNPQDFTVFSDEYFMNLAFLEAQKAAGLGEVPVGAVLVHQNRVIAKTHNLTERLMDVTAHAEILAVTAGAQALGGKYLKDCVLYVTLEPCVMCAGALFLSQLSRVVFATSDSHRGFVGKGVKLHPKTTHSSGVMAEECSQILKDFFTKYIEKWIIDR